MNLRHLGAQGLAGNYAHRLPLGPEAFASARGVRLAHARRPKAPRWAALAMRHGLVSNWSGFYREVALPGARQLAQLPVLPPLPGFGLLIIFRPCHDRLAAPHAHPGRTRRRGVLHRAGWGGHGAAGAAAPVGPCVRALRAGRGNSGGWTWFLALSSGAGGREAGSRRATARRSGGCMRGPPGGVVSNWQGLPEQPQIKHVLVNVPRLRWTWCPRHHWFQHRFLGSKRTSHQAPVHSSDFAEEIAAGFTSICLRGYLHQPFLHRVELCETDMQRPGSCARTECQVRVSLPEALVRGARSSGVEVGGYSFGPLAPSNLANDPSVSAPSMALLALVALLGVQAEDPACLLQSHKAQALTTTCPHGFETYDFSTWPAKLYATDDGPPEGGIKISSFQATSNCLRPGIFNSTNGDDSDTDILACKCNALVMAEAGSTDNDIDDCKPGKNQFPWIDLTFDEPQTILAVQFFDIEETGNTKLTYTVTGGAEQTATVTKGGDGEPSPLDLSGLTNPAPINIEKIRLLSSRGDSFSGAHLGSV